MACDIGRIIPRWLLSTFNFIILIFTFLLVLVSVLLVCVPGHMKDLLVYTLSWPRLEVAAATQEAVTHNLTSAVLHQVGVATLTLSSVLLVPALAGYVGAVRESRVCLILYFAPLLVVWAAQLTFLIVLPMVRGPVYSLLASLATASLEMFTETGTDTEAEEGQGGLVSLVWTVVMVRLQCCGVTGHEDFRHSPAWTRDTKHTKQMLPAACCMLDPGSASFPLSRVEPVDPHCTTVPTKYNSYWTQGCLPAAASLASQHTSLVILAVISLLTLEIVLVILATCLCLLQRFRGDKETRSHTVIVKRAYISPNTAHSEASTWQEPGLQEAEHKKLIYNDMRNDIIVP